MAERSELDRLQFDYADKFGLGPCGAVAAALRAAGLGQIQTGHFGPEGDYTESFPHFWIKRPDGRIMDIVNPELYRKGSIHWDVEDLRPDEMPEVTGAKEVAFVLPYLRRAGIIRGKVRGRLPKPAGDPAHAGAGGKRRHSHLASLVADINRLVK